MPDPFKLLGVDPERAKQGAAYAGTQALDFLYTPLYMKALGDALSSFMGSTPQQPQQEAPTPEAAPYQALTGALMEPLRRVGQEQSGRVAELEALYPQFVQEALTGMRGLGDQYAEANPELGPILAIMQLFHGSPHRFSKFRHADEVARTGQGANTYGHGIYLAEKPGVAKSYFHNLHGKTDQPRLVEGEVFNLQNPKHLAAHEVEKAYSIDKAIAKLEAEAAPLRRLETDRDWELFNDERKRLGMSVPRYPEDRDRLEEALKILKSREVPHVDYPGGLYNVTGDFDPEDLLDWDAPLSEQSPRVQASLNKLWNELPVPQNEKHLSRPQLPDDATGEEIYTRLARRWDQETASKALADAGIPGLRYLDQGSRTAKDGTRNVVWWGDPDKLQIQGVDKSRR